jgi:hypothetical protein
MIQMKRKNNRMFGPLSLVRWCASLSLLTATVLVTPSFSQGTAAQRVACTPDALRLCSAFIPNADEVTTCLKANSTELSNSCKAAFEAAMDQPAGVNDGIKTRKRTGR